MNFETFCEENDALFRKLAHEMNDIESRRKALSPRNTYFDVDVCYNQDRVNDTIEEFGLTDSDKEQAVELATQEMWDYDNVGEDLVGDEISDYVCETNGRIVPVFKHSVVSEYAQQPLHLFDYATEQGIISINGGRPSDVLDYEDGFSHTTVNFTPSRDVYDEEDDDWADELERSKSMIDEIETKLIRPLSNALEEIRVINDRYPHHTISMDITDNILCQLDEFES